VEDQIAPHDVSQHGLLYARTEYSLVLKWYQSAESKAQIMLTVNGALITVVAKVVFDKTAKDVASMRASYSSSTWALLAVTLLCLVGSIWLCVRCLWSRVYRSAEMVPSDRRPTLIGSLGFFQKYAALDVSELHRMMADISADDELKVICFQLVNLGQRVTKKHRLVNFAFLSTLIGLGAMALAAATRLTGI
jgi:hypothetical protein